MTTCRETIDELLQYLEGGLADDARKKFEEHFSGCQPCEEFLATYLETPNICRKALSAKMPAEFASKLTGFLRDELKKSK